METLGFVYKKKKNLVHHYYTYKSGIFLTADDSIQKYSLKHFQVYKYHWITLKLKAYSELPKR